MSELSKSARKLGFRSANDALWREIRYTELRDALLAKVIAWGRDRPEAVARMQRALDEFTVVGVTTNIDAHKKILASEAFKAGQVTTHLIDTVGIEALSA